MKPVSVVLISRCLTRLLRDPVIAVLLILAVARVGWASDVDIPHTFQANSPAVAAEVNENFGAVKSAVNDNDSRIAALETALAAQQAMIASLQSALAAVQNNTVLALDGKLGLGIDSKGYDTARFTAVNVQVVNGLGGTETTNGLGNLTIGYNESSTTETPFCADGNYDNQTDCESNGDIWAADQRTGSHNLVLGRANAYSKFGGLVVGVYHIINGQFASVSGGYSNTASGYSASVSGGSYGEASGYSASVSGGQDNTASASSTSVSGGSFGEASAIGASVSGGFFNIASGNSASVSGGSQNVASGVVASVSGGQTNTASSNVASVSGGSYNEASGIYASVSGGSHGSAPDLDDWVAGNLFQDQ